MGLTPDGVVTPDTTSYCSRENASELKLGIQGLLLLLYPGPTLEGVGTILPE